MNSISLNFQYVPIDIIVCGMEQISEVGNSKIELTYEQGLGTKTFSIANILQSSENRCPITNLDLTDESYVLLTT